MSSDWAWLRREGPGSFSSHIQNLSVRSGEESAPSSPSTLSLQVLSVAHLLLLLRLSPTVPTPAGGSLLPPGSLGPPRA